LAQTTQARLSLDKYKMKLLSSSGCLSPLWGTGLYALLSIIYVILDLMQPNTEIQRPPCVTVGYVLKVCHLCVFICSNTTVPYSVFISCYCTYSHIGTGTVTYIYGIGAFNIILCVYSVTCIPGWAKV
jgi:hypothetical protein